MCWLDHIAAGESVALIGSVWINVPSTMSNTMSLLDVMRILLVIVRSWCNLVSVFSQRLPPGQVQRLMVAGGCPKSCSLRGTGTLNMVEGLAVACQPHGHLARPPIGPGIIGDGREILLFECPVCLQCLRATLKHRDTTQ